MSVPSDQLLQHAEPAEQLLFAALSADRAALASLDAEGWRGLCEVAIRTFTAPLLHATLSQNRLLGAAPEEVVVRLARARAWSAARWDHSAGQVAALARALDGVGVPCLVLKGAHTGHLYEERGARCYGDIDLLVPHDRLELAAKTLLSCGYRAGDARRGGHADGEHRHLPPMRIDHGLPVELHWTLARRTGTPTWSAGVWERAVRLPDGVALGMDPVDALLYTCKHLAADHAFATTNGIAGLADVRVLLAARTPDPQELRDRALAWGVLPSVCLCLHLAHHLLGVEVPQPVLDAVHVDGVERIAPRAVWTLLHVGRLGATRHLLFRTRATLNPAPPVSAVGGFNKLSAVWTYVHRSSLPAVDDLRLEFPALGRWAPLGYPIHWSRLAWRHAGLVRLARARTRAEAWDRMRDHEAVLRAWLA